MTYPFCKNCLRQVGFSGARNCWVHVATTMRYCEPNNNANMNMATPTMKSTGDDMLDEIIHSKQFMEATIPAPPLFKKVLFSADF